VQGSVSQPFLVCSTLFGGTPRGFDKYKDQGIETIGGTPGTSSRYPSVPRQPGWESLQQGLVNRNSRTNSITEKKFDKIN